MGVTPAWVRKAIGGGVIVGPRLVVKLEAEVIMANRRRMYRIHEDQFVTFLRAIGSTRLPAGSGDTKR